MNKLLLFFGVLVMLCGACSSNYYYKQGNFNKTVYRLQSKIRKANPKAKHVLLFEKAYKAAVTQELDRIAYLKQEGAPENWSRVFRYYESIKRKQEIVRPLLPLAIPGEYRDADIKLINVDAQMKDAKVNAADFHYDEAKKLLANNNRMDARAAYDHLQQLKQYFNSYKDINTLEATALERGTVQVALVAINNSNQILPQSVLESIAVDANLNDTWRQFHNHPNNKNNYQYEVSVRINEVNISQEQTSEKNWVEEADIENGFDYVLDDNGNVMKDTAGNDIKVTRYKTVTANVTDVLQQKQGIMRGTIEIISLERKAVLHQQPFEKNLIFENRFVTYQGDKRALKTATVKQLGGGFAPYPSNEKMAVDGIRLANEELKAVMAQKIGLFQ